MLNWLKKRLCKHHWTVMYRGKMESLWRCDKCGCETWFRN